jgi:FkbM family methyltransferase
MPQEIIQKLQLARTIKASVIDKIRLALYLLKYQFDKRNTKIDMLIEIDGIKYKLVDLESLFVVSPRYEEVMLEYLTPRKGEVFVDVGAHIGKYALRIAKMVGSEGKVIAIEPDPENFRALVCGINLNRLTNVVVLNVAAWDRECKLTLYLGETDRKLSNGGLYGRGESSVKRKIGQQCEVLAKPLDDIIQELNINRIDWVKIDAEGAEYEILKGFIKTVKSQKPKIIAECTINQGKTIELMKKLGYNTISIAPNYFFFQPAEKLA